MEEIIHFIKLQIFDDLSVIIKPVYLNHTIESRRVHNHQKQSEGLKENTKLAPSETLDLTRSHSFTRIPPQIQKNHHISLILIKIHIGSFYPAQHFNGHL